MLVVKVVFLLVSLSAVQKHLYDGMVMIVGDQYITLSDLMKREGLYRELYKPLLKGMSPKEFERDIRKKAISDEIFSRLVLELGKKMKIRISDKEAESYLSDKMKKSKFKDVLITQKKVERIIAYMRSTDARFKEILQSSVSDDEVRAYYDSHKKDFMVEGASFCIIALKDLKGAGLKDDRAKDEFFRTAEKILKRSRNPKQAERVFRLFKKRYSKYRFTLADFSKSVELKSAFYLLDNFPQEVAGMVLSPNVVVGKVYRFPPLKIPSLGNELYDIMVKVFDRKKIPMEMDDRLKKQIIAKIRDEKLLNWVKKRAFKRGVSVEVVDERFWKKHYFDIGKVVSEFLGGSR